MSAAQTTPPRPKVCVIGLQKTGTTSLAAALRALGLRMGQATNRLAREVDWKQPDPAAEITRIALDVLAQSDGVSDSPYGFVFKAVDATFPGTKFILTNRSYESWIESYRAYFPDGNNPLRRWMYGVPRLSGHEAQYRAAFEGQHAMMRTYFAGRAQDFLEMDLARGDGWAELVKFLAPDHFPPFPHKNRGTASAR